MIQFDDAREMERRSSLYYGDGLLDIGIGIGLIILGFGMLFGLGILASVYMAMLFSIVKSAKRSITVPRMHHLDFIPEPDVESKLRRGRAVVAISLGLLSALGVLSLCTSRLIPSPVSMVVRAHAIAIFGCPLAAIFMLAAWGTATRRLRAYAAIAVLALVFGYWFDLNVSWCILLLGAVTSVWGACALGRFMRDYPRFYNRNGRMYQRI
jgi:hypothetical protein